MKILLLITRIRNDNNFKIVNQFQRVMNYNYFLARKVEAYLKMINLNTKNLFVYSQICFYFY